MLKFSNGNEKPVDVLTPARVAVRCILVALVASPLLGPAVASETAASPRLLVHLLDYLNKDYGGAVSNGQILNATEYREQVEFAREARAISRTLPDTRDSADIVAGIDTLVDLVNHKANAAEVASLASRLRQRVIQVSNIAEAPEHWPSLVNGRRLYLKDCAPCHGERGLGDGPASTGLRPPPTDFSAEPTASDISPFRVSNTIRLGIPGTAMAAWPALTDSEVWDLAFYVTSLHVKAPIARSQDPDSLLFAVSTQSDRQLMMSLPGGDAEKRTAIAGLRLHSMELPVTSGALKRTGPTNPLALARSYMAVASDAYARADFDGAARAALLAYLEGIEPVEPQLRAKDAEFVVNLEQRMSAVRSAIAARRPNAEVQRLIHVANQDVVMADDRLSGPAAGPWVTFALTAGILLREGFEAVLILIALLAVLRAAGSARAARWVHGGWAAALAVGLMAWFLTGWLMAFSGAQREMLEAVTALIAVVVLVYVGFWLHRRTEISRWAHFIEVQVRGMLYGGNLWGLAGIAFMAVFREAFETVMFLRAVALEGSATGMRAMALGVLASLVGLIGLTWLLLKASARLQIRKVFMLSSALMLVLAIILTGKGLHALQETGALAETSTPWRWTTDLLGIYATWETLLPQILIAIGVTVLWRYGDRPRERHA